MKKLNILIVTIFYFSLITYGQKNSYIIGDRTTDLINPIESNINLRVNKEISAYSDSLPILNYEVVVHVFHLGEEVGIGTNISDQKIQDMIKDLNLGMAADPGNAGNIDTKLRFKLAEKDTLCLPTKGINRIDASKVGTYGLNGINYGTSENVAELQALSKWNARKYINIWVVHKITNGAIAFAYYPYNESSLDDLGFGIMIGINSLGALTHEMGHIFGLTHEDMQCNDTTSYSLYSTCATKKMRTTALNQLSVLTNKIACNSNISNEAAFISATVNKSTYCATESINAKFQIKNLGNNTINSLKIEQKINEIQQADLLLSNLNIKPNSTEDIDIPITLNQKGVFEFKYNILEVNGVTDAYNFNDSLQSFSFRLSPMLNLPLDFETGNPDDFFLIKTDNYSNFSIYNGAKSNGTKSLLINGNQTVYTNTYPSKTLLSFCINLDNSNLNELTFDRKQNKYNFGSLGIKVNGNVERIEMDKPVPETDQWIYDTLNLSSYNGYVEIELSTVVKYDINYPFSGKGDYLILDNFKISKNPVRSLKIDFIASSRYGCSNSNQNAIDLSTKFNVSVKGNPQPIKYEWFVEGAYPNYANGKTSPQFAYYYFLDGNSYDVKLRYTMPNGKIDSIIKHDFIRTNPVSGYDIYDFETKNDLWPTFITNTISFNTISDTPWEHVQNLGAYGASNGSYRINFEKKTKPNSTYSNNAINVTSLPIIDSIPDSYNSLVFDYAYLPSYQSKVWGELDSIFVFCRQPCESNRLNYIELKKYKKSELIKSGITYDYNAMVPMNNYWQTDTIDISSIKKLRNISFGFMIKGEIGANAIYFDNLRLIKEAKILDIENFEIQYIQPKPNPVISILELDDKLIGDEFTISNIVGKRIMTGNLKTNLLDVNTLEPGVYLLSIISKNQSYLNFKFIK